MLNKIKIKEEAEHWALVNLNALRSHGVTPSTLREAASDESNERKEYACELLEYVINIKDILGFESLESMYDYYKKKIRETFDEAK